MLKVFVNPGELAMRRVPTRTHRLVASFLLGLGVVSSTNVLAGQQLNPRSPKHPTFEVAAIRQSGQDPASFGWKLEASGRFRGMAMTVKEIICAAYGIRPWAVSGGPGWVDKTRFDISADTDPESAALLNKLPTKARDAEIGLMLQTLLSERFGLRIQDGTKVVPYFVLMVAKDGPKMSLSKSDLAAPAPPQLTLSSGQFVVHAMSMESWATQVSEMAEVSRDVINGTGLAGNYDFDFVLPASDGGSGESLYTALDEQLGLRLEARKGPRRAIDIQEVHIPTDN